MKRKAKKEQFVEGKSLQCKIKQGSTNVFVAYLNRNLVPLMLGLRGRYEINLKILNKFK